MKYKIITRDEFKPVNDTAILDKLMTHEKKRLLADRGEDLVMGVWMAKAHDRLYFLIYVDDMKNWHWQSWDKNMSLMFGGSGNYISRDKAFMSAYMDYLKEQESMANNLPAEEDSNLASVHACRKCHALLQVDEIIKNNSLICPNCGENANASSVEEYDAEKT